MEAAICSTCKFYQPESGPSVGECRKNPPTVIADSKADSGCFAVWPKIHFPDEEWCGKWTPRIGEPAPDPEVFSWRLSKLFGVRVCTALRYSNHLGASMHFVKDVVNSTADELCEYRNFGKTSLAEVRQKLAQFGLKLKGD